MEWHLDKKIIDFGFDDEDTIVIDWNDGRRSAFDPYPYMKGAMEKLLDEDYLKLAYLTGYGRSIAWPGNLDFGVQLLYEASVTDSSETPLPPRAPTAACRSTQLRRSSRPRRARAPASRTRTTRSAPTATRGSRTAHRSAPAETR